jgi:ribosomal subunit interface protein
MNVSITFRHVDPSDALKRYSEEKIAKLQKFLRQPMTAKVTLSLDRLKQVGKLERQIRGAHGAAKAKVRGAETVRKAKVTRVPDLEVEAAPRAKSAAKLVKKSAKKRPAKAKA